MAKPSKTVRRLRNAKKAQAQAERKAAVLNALVEGSGVKNAKLAGIAVEEHVKAKRLAKLLAFVVMKTGGRLVIPDSELAEMPDDAKLGEERDVLKHHTILVSIAPKQEKPLIEVVSA